MAVMIPSGGGGSKDASNVSYLQSFTSDWTRGYGIPSFFSGFDCSDKDINNNSEIMFSVIGTGTVTGTSSGTRLSTGYILKDGNITKLHKMNAQYFPHVQLYNCASIRISESKFLLFQSNASNDGNFPLYFDGFSVSGAGKISNISYIIRENIESTSTYFKHTGEITVSNPLSTVVYTKYATCVRKDENTITLIALCATQSNPPQYASGFILFLDFAINTTDNTITFINSASYRLPFNSGCGPILGAAKDGDRIYLFIQRSTAGTDYSNTFSYIDNSYQTSIFELIINANDYTVISPTDNSVLIGLLGMRFIRNKGKVYALGFRANTFGDGGEGYRITNAHKYNVHPTIIEMEKDENGIYRPSKLKSIDIYFVSGDNSLYYYHTWLMFFDNMYMYEPIINRIYGSTSDDNGQYFEIAGFIKHDLMSNINSKINIITETLPR